LLINNKKLKDDLFILIKSLTKSEKGYIKKFALRHRNKSGNNYIMLLDEIEKQTKKNKYDELFLKQKFTDKHFVKNFPVAKAYVYETILRSLNSYYTNSNKDNELKEKVRSIEILYRKALYPQCLKLLKRTKAEAIRYDNFTQQLELIKWERNLIHEGAYPGETYENLERTYQEEKEILSKIQNIGDYRMMSYRVMNAGKQNKPGSIKKYLDHNLLQSEERALSYPAKINFHHIRASIFDEAGEIKNAYRERRKTIEIMEQYPEKIKENRINYLISLYNLTSMCYKLKYYDELSACLRKIRSIPEKVSKGISENIRMLMFIGPSTLSLKMLIDKGEFEKGTGEEEEIRKNLDEYNNKLNPVDKLTCIYFLAYVYFGAGKYQEALFLLNTILNEKNEYPGITESSMILILIIHFELKNFELLEYLIKSVYRRLRKQKTLNESQRELILFFKKTADAVSEKELKVIFKETKKRITNLKNSWLAEYFDIESWLESKITGKPFANIMKEKYLRTPPQN
jgi:hypothetical protein